MNRSQQQRCITGLWIGFVNGWFCGWVECESLTTAALYDGFLDGFHERVVLWLVECESLTTATLYDGFVDRFCERVVMWLAECESLTTATLYLPTEFQLRREPVNERGTDEGRRDHSGVPGASS